MNTTSQTRKEAPFFSVVIPLYNKEKNIERTISSILSQSFSDYEIIVVDDGSTDNGPGLVRSKFGSQVRLVEKANGGVSSARNLGIKHSEGQWIALLDADDYWRENFLTVMRQMIDDFPGNILYGTAYDVLSGQEKSGRVFPLEKSFRGVVDEYWEIARKSLLFCSSAVVFNKYSAINIGGFDTDLTVGEDLDFWIRMNLQGKSAFYNKAFAVYNQDGENRAMTKKHDYCNSVYSKIGSLKRSNSDDRRFVAFCNYFMARNAPALLGVFLISKESYMEYLNDIDDENTPFFLMCFLSCPVFVQRLLSYVYYNMRSMLK